MTIRLVKRRRNRYTGFEQILLRSSPTKEGLDEDDMKRSIK